MPRSILAVVLMSCLLSPAPSLASEKLCAEYFSNPKYNKGAFPLKEKKPEWCQCGSEISEIDILPPPGFSLVAACDVKKVHNSYYGMFIFGGETTLTGKIIRADDDVGTYFLFRSDYRTPFSEFKSALNDAQFYTSDSFALKSFRAPTPANFPSCWQAKATIRIMTFTFLSGPGGDQKGAWPMEYEVLNVGRYEDCRAGAACGNPIDEGVVDGDVVNVRENPDIDSRVLRTAAKGVRITVLMRESACIRMNGKEGQWVRVKLHDNGPVKEGWLFDAYIKYEHHPKQL